MNLRHMLVIDYYIGGLLHVLLKLPTMLLGRLLRRDHRIGPDDEVVILKLLGGGSLVIAYPSLLQIKRTGRRLSLVTTSGIKPFAEVLGIFDHIHVIREHSVGTLLFDSLVTIGKLFRCPLIVDLEIHSRLSTVFCLLTCARNRVSFYSLTAFWRRNLATHLLYFNQHAPVYQFYDQVSSLLQAKPSDFDDARQAFREQIAGGRRAAADGATGTNLVKDSPKIAEIKLPENFTHIGIAATCSNLCPERMLRIDEWAMLVKQRISDVPSTCIHLLGGPDDREYLAQLAAAISEGCPGLRVRNHAGELRLEQSVMLLAKLDRLLAIDSSLLHFARLLGVPTESWWGPTNPVTLLRELKEGEAHYRRLSCSPCVHVTGERPCRGDNRCMRVSLMPPELAIVDNPIWLLPPGASRPGTPADAER